MANAAQGAQQFVNTQQDRGLALQDRAEAKGREQQYDTALGLRAQGINEKPSGTSNAVWNQANMDQNKVEASNMQAAAAKQSLADKETVRKKYAEYVKGYIAAGKQGGPQAQLQYAKTRIGKSLEDDTALALFQGSMKRNVASANLIKQANIADAQELYARLTKDLGDAATEYARTGSTSSAIAFQQTVNDSPFPYDVKYDPNTKMYQKMLTIDGVIKPGGYISMQDLMSFAKNISAEKFTAQYLQVTSQASNENANALLKPQVWTNGAGEKVSVVKLVNNKNMSQTTYNVYSEDGGKVSGGNNILEQLYSKGFTPGKAEVKTPESPYSKSNYASTRDTWQESYLQHKGFTKKSIYDENTGTTTKQYVDGNNAPVSAEVLQEAEMVSRRADEILQGGGARNSQRALEMAERERSVYTQAKREFLADHPEYTGKTIPKDALRTYYNNLVQRQTQPQTVDRTAWSAPSLMPGQQGAGQGLQVQAPVIRK